MRIIQAITLSALLGGTTLACSLPVIAVIVHKRDLKTEPNFAATDHKPDGLRLYDGEGYIVAHCDRQGEDLVNCRDREGRDVTDLMNAWYHAWMSEFQDAR